MTENMITVALIVGDPGHEDLQLNEGSLAAAAKMIEVHGAASHGRWDAGRRSRTRRSMLRQAAAAPAVSVRPNKSAVDRQAGVPRTGRSGGAATTNPPTGHPHQSAFGAVWWCVA
jgi:hypothetical protein